MSNSKLFNSDKGLTLVEILASLVVLALIFISIITILNQSAKTNKASEEIIDATYIAQQEMEFIYKESKKNSSLINKDGYIEQPQDGDWNVYHKLTEGHNYLIEIKEDISNFPMVRIVVKVFETNDLEKDNPKAQMETLLKWGGENETTP